MKSFLSFLIVLLALVFVAVVFPAYIAVELVGAGLFVILWIIYEIVSIFIK